MKNLVISLLLFLVVLSACRSLQNEGGLDWATVDFTISGSSKNTTLRSTSASANETALIIAVPGNRASVSVSDYLATAYDEQLQNLVTDSVSLSIPTNTSIRLAKIVFNETLTLESIINSQPTADYTGISDTFSVDGSEQSKRIVVTFINCIVGTSTIGSCKLVDS